MFEPKTLYRAGVEEVPEDSFECEIGKADTLRSGDDVTIIGWGTQIHVLLEVADMAKKDLNINCEVIDLVSILPWDKDAVCKVIFIFSLFSINSTPMQACNCSICSQKYSRHRELVEF